MNAVLQDVRSERDTVQQNRRLRWVLLLFILVVLTAPGAAFGNQTEANGWMSFPQETGAAFVPAEDDIDHYAIAKAVDFNGKDEIEIRYSVSGQQWHRCALLRDADGVPLVEDQSTTNQVHTLYGTPGNESISLEDSLTRTRTVTIRGLQENTAYQLYWGQGQANGKNPQCDIILTFTTGSKSWDYDFTRDKRNRTGRNFIWKQKTKTLTLSGMEDPAAKIVLPKGATVQLAKDTVNQVASVQGRGALTIKGSGALNAGEIAKAGTALYAKGPLNIAGCSITAVGTKHGIYAKGKITVQKALVDARGSKAGALRSGAKKLAAAKMTVKVPAKGKIRSGRIVTGAGKPAAHAVLRMKGTCLVRFQSAGGSPVAPQLVAKGKKARQPVTPHKDDYVLRAWLYQGKAYRFTTPVKKDMTLQADWVLDGPKQNWIVFSDSAIVYDHSEIAVDAAGDGGASGGFAAAEIDYYVAKTALPFHETGRIQVAYRTSGQQDHTVEGLALRDAGGQVISTDPGQLIQTVGNNRDVQVTGLQGETVYQLYWPQYAVNGRNPRRAVVLTFTTGVRQNQLTASLAENAWAYTGQSIQPKPTVQAQGQTLEEGRDYALAYERADATEEKDRFNTVDAGTITIRVTGMGSYAGQQTSVTYRISRLDLRDAAVSLTGSLGTDSGGTARYSYTGQAIRPQVKVLYQGKELILDTDYRVTYYHDAAALTDAGAMEKIPVIISGIGNYNGGVTCYYNIVR